MAFRQQRERSAIFVIAGAEFLVFLLNGLDRPDLNLLASVAVHLLVCAVLFDGGRGRKIYLTVLIWFILGFTEFFTLFVLDMTLGWQTVHAAYGVGGFFFAAVMTKAAAYGVVKLLCHSLPPVMEESDRKIMVVFILFPGASIALFAGLALLDLRLSGGAESRVFLGRGSLMIFILNLLVIELYGKVSRITNQAKYYERNETKNELLNMQYTRAKEIRQQIHNVGNQMKTIQILARQGQAKEIVELTKQWAETMEGLTDDRFCASEVLNAILNEKRGEARQRGVRTEIFVEAGFSAGRVREQDMIGIVGNLLDNAIEAAQQREGGCLKAELFRANEGRLLLFKVENNFAVAPMQENGQFVTRKADNVRHGFGIQYVRDTVEEYGGWCRFEVEDGLFRAVVMIPL